MALTPHSHGDPPAALLAWARDYLDPMYAHAIEVGISALAGNEPATIGYLASEGKRLLAKLTEIAPSTRASYASRIRRAAYEYVGHAERRTTYTPKPMPVFYEPKAAPPPERSLEDEIADMCLAMGRCRRLRVHLLKHLVAAIAAEEAKEKTA